MKKASTPDELLNTEIKIVDEVGLLPILILFTTFNYILIFCSNFTMEVADDAFANASNFAISGRVRN